MAVQRTYEEKSAILAHCLKLEAEGGDILAYLWSQDYLTPRATWCNFQREWLGRKPYEFTSGKPNERREKKRMNTKQKMLTDAQRMECARIAIDGGDPKPYIAELGFKVPSSVWHNVKKWYERNDPETFRRIPDRVGRVVGREVPAVDKGMPKKLELAEGVNYELSVAETPEAPRKPMSFGGYDVTAIRHPVFGEFYYDRKYEHIDWRTPEGEEVSMKPEDWVRFGLCIPDMMGILGVKV